MPQSLPCQGHGSPSFPSFPGKGRELPLLLPHIPTAEPGDCDELRVRGASGRFLAPAGRPAAIARLLLPAQPCSLPAVPPRLHHGGGHQAVTLARPRSPQPSPVTGSQANRDNGREEQGQAFPWCLLPAHHRCCPHQPGHMWVKTRIRAGCCSHALSHSTSLGPQVLFSCLWERSCGPALGLPSALGFGDAKGTCCGGSQLPLAHAAAYKAGPGPAAGQRRWQRRRQAAPGPPSPPPAARFPRFPGTMRTALLLLALLALPARTARPKLALPIRPDSEPLPPGGAAGCAFGGHFYALEETWHPDLGEPFGVMRCVICHCETRNRRGKPVGKVNCKNMKQDCPVPTCPRATLLPGHCCHTCPKALPGPLEKSSEPPFDTFEYFQDKEDEMDKPYNDRSYLSSEGLARDDARTEFVALLTSGPEPWHPTSSAVAKARFTLLRSYLLFSISYERLGRPSRVRFSDPDGTVLFEHPVQKSAAPEDGMLCGMWRTVSKANIQLLRAEQLRVSLITRAQPSGEVHGHILKHRALFAETFGAILTSSDPTHLGAGGMAMLTLSDTENNLHFILMARGLLEPGAGESPWVPLRVRILHQGQTLREVHANITMEDPDFAEVLSDLSTHELQWLAQGQLRIVADTEGQHPRQLEGTITARRSCDTIQSVLCGADALQPTKTGAVGSAKLALHENGTLEYQVRVVGTASEVVGVTLETKPRRKNKRNVLFDMTPSYRDGLAQGVWHSPSARDAHMLLQNELFLNVATKDWVEGELRGQVISLPYSGLLARYTEMPVPLAGQLVSPTVSSGAGGHAWLSLDEHCHLHYEIVVAGLGRPADGTVSAQLHGVAELGEMGSRPHLHKRMLKGFYGTEAQGVVKDLDAELLQHLAQGTAFLQVSTKAHPRGEMRGWVHIPNRCQAGGARLSTGEAGLSEGPKSRDVEQLKKDPNSCFFEGQHRAHGTRWAPDYDKKCSICSCQKRTVICDPILCQPLNCTRQVHPEELCCPVCEEKKMEQEQLKLERARDSSEGCYFDGDKTWRGSGTRWHPVVPPFGLIKCAICTCKGTTGEVHCEKVQCPRLTCANPVRVSPSDCCKQCPAPEKSVPELTDGMQADGPRACRFGRRWYLNNESWHPSVPPFGEMKCILCWCVSGETHCQRQECPPGACASPSRRDNPCCAKCRALDAPPEKMHEATAESWSH
ncbi:chordin isoform X3 [Tympanuchus pallidicinctus]|uniref:chordin isoform X3 n=1 Tax=Tympanuchus pallidicinctus TaxID=109042 RepID=UPI002286D1C6|nr:chordin isoform X3 [Tympanuchus pallidicinctus]